MTKTPRDQLIDARALQLRREATPAERALWAQLRDFKQYGFHFTRQHRVGNYIVDLACRSERFAVELDGEGHAAQAEYDRTRTAWLEGQGWRVLRFWNGDVLADPEAVARSVLGVLTGETRIGDVQGNHPAAADSRAHPTPTLPCKQGRESASAHVAHVALRDFRSYLDQGVSVSAGPVVVTGENGAGKTNLLEAISLLSPGRGLRGVALAEVARTGGPGHWAVAATIDSGGAVEIGTGTTATARERRQVRVNGAAAPIAALGEWLSILWLTPAMDRLFSEGASGRRRFLDRLTLALHPGHASHAARYDAAMRARNRLLAEDAGADPGWLAALERQMAEHGEALAAARRDTVAALAERLADTPDGPFARARVRLDGWGADALEDGVSALATELRQRRGQDAAAGRATAGPHRSDLAVVHAGKNQPAEMCSTGEQKALLLGLVLAHAAQVGERRGRAPVLLLDEVAAHLDAARREALFGRLVEMGAQVWMTGTDRSLFAGLESLATFVAVSDGQLMVG